MALRRLLPGLLLWLCTLPAGAALTVVDADGVTLTLAAPAQRIVSLAPHLTDALLELGARAQLVGVVDDHPQGDAPARPRGGLPVVADAGSLNYERVLAARPDLVLAWAGGTPRPWIARLRTLGLPVFVTAARRLDDIPGETELLGRLSGHEALARRQAAAQRALLARLGRVYGGGPRLRYFHQVWRQPLYTLGADHLLSQALALCGADNVVPPGRIAAPLVSPEFVLRANPDILVFDRADAAGTRAYWSRFPTLTAVRRQQWLALDDARLTRPGAGMLSALPPVCAQIASWRKRMDIKRQ